MYSWEQLGVNRRVWGIREVETARDQDREWGVWPGEHKER